MWEVFYDFQICSQQLHLLRVFTISNPIHCCYTFSPPPCSQGRHLLGSVHLPPGSWPYFRRLRSECVGVLQELSEPVDFHFSCFLLLSLLLKWFLCPKSSNPLFLWILLISLINYAPRQLISTSVKLKGCKCYLISEEELEVPEVYVSFSRVSAVWLWGIISLYKPSRWIFHTVLLI